MKHRREVLMFDIKAKEEMICFRPSYCAPEALASSNSSRPTILGASHQTSHRFKRIHACNPFGDCQLPSTANVSTRVSSITHGRTWPAHRPWQRKRNLSFKAWGLGEESGDVSGTLWPKLGLVRLGQSRAEGLTKSCFYMLRVK